MTFSQLVNVKIVSTVDNNLGELQSPQAIQKLPVSPSSFTKDTLSLWMSMIPTKCYIDGKGGIEKESSISPFWGASDNDKDQHFLNVWYTLLLQTP